MTPEKKKKGNAKLKRSKTNLSPANKKSKTKSPASKGKKGKAEKGKKGKAKDTGKKGKKGKKEPEPEPESDEEVASEPEPQEEKKDTAVRDEILKKWNEAHLVNVPIVNGQFQPSLLNKVRSFLTLGELYMSRRVNKMWNEVKDVPVELLPSNVTINPWFNLEEIEQGETLVLPPKALMNSNINSFSAERHVYYPLLIGAIPTVEKIKFDNVEEDIFIAPVLPKLKNLEFQQCSQNVVQDMLKKHCGTIEHLILDPDLIFAEDTQKPTFEKLRFPKLKYLSTALDIIVDFEKCPELTHLQVAGNVAFRNQQLNKIESIMWSEKNCTNWSSEFVRHLKYLTLMIHLDETHFLLPIILDCLGNPNVKLEIEVSYDITELWLRLDRDSIEIVDCDLEDDEEDDEGVHKAFTKFLRDLVNCHPNPDLNIKFNRKMGGQRLFSQRIVLRWFEGTGLLQTTVSFRKRKVDNALEDISHE